MFTTISKLNHTNTTFAGMNVLENYSLQHFHTFGINVKADFVCEVSSIDEFKSIWQDSRFVHHPKLILGEGSNVLFQNDFSGLVIVNRIKGFEYKISEDNKSVLCKFMSGENWHDAVLKTLKLGFYGLENLSLIPGTVGAAPIQNIGAYGVELKDSFVSLEALNLKTGDLECFDLISCAFGYRDSIFKQLPRNSYFIYSVTLQLSTEPTIRISYGDIQKQIASQGIKNITPIDVSNAVISIRNSKLPNPKELGNSGSFFKNPQVSAAHFERLQLQHPDIKGFSLDNGEVKIPAAWLIEKTGWKGKIVGNTGSHSNQALVLVNYGNASGSEVVALSKAIRDSVLLQFDIQLEPEVNII